MIVTGKFQWKIVITTPNNNQLITKLIKNNNRNICSNREYVLNTVTILANGFQNGLQY